MTGKVYRLASAFGTPLKMGWYGAAAVLGSKTAKQRTDFKSKGV